MKRLRRVLYALFALCLFFPNVLSASAKEEYTPAFDLTGVEG